MVRATTIDMEFDYGQQYFSCGESKHNAQQKPNTKRYPSSFVASKKGYFYFVEIALIAMLLVTFFFAFSPKAEMSYQNLNDINNLKLLGYGTLKSLDDKGILSTYVPNTNMANSNFTALRTYIKNALPATADSRIEYAENSTSCYSEYGVAGSCGLNLTDSKNLDVARADYIYSKRPSPITVHLYLWRVL